LLRRPSPLKLPWKLKRDKQFSMLPNS